MTESGTKCWDMDENDLAAVLVGHRVTTVDVQAKTLTIDNGTVFAFEDASDCCSWFEAGLTLGTLTNNAVTAVQREQRKSPEHEGDDESWTLHILAADTTIASVEIEGTEGSGYYCHSVTLRVKEMGA